MKRKICCILNSINATLTTMKLTPDALERYINSLEHIYEEKFHQLTPWRRKFVTSVRDQLLTKSTLSKKQMDILDDIFAEHIE